MVIPIVSYFTWTLTGAKGEGQAGWTSFGIIVGLLGILTAWTVAFGTKESTNALRAKAQNSGFFILYDKLINDAVKNTAKNPADI